MAFLLGGGSCLVVVFASQRFLPSAFLPVVFPPVAFLLVVVVALMSVWCPVWGR